MSYFLFLDDIRTFNQVKFPINSDYQVKSAKNFDEFRSIVERHGTPGIVSFDFDLCPEHYEKFISVQEGYNPYKFRNKCGLHCVDFLIQHVQEKGTSFPAYFCHSANPKGKKLILDKLKNVKLENSPKKACQA
jgi:hypothetical protein